MKGDFSRFDYTPLDNFTGVLEQQGRGRIDQDGNAAEEIARHLRTLVGRDAFGPHSVSVPAAEHDSLRIVAASTDGSDVQIEILPGRAWVSGIPLHVPGPAPAVYSANYLQPPLQSPAADPSSIDANVRDAVILEVWEESVSGYQAMPTLLEPALGGPDTTERVKVCHRLRLRRLAPEEDCETIKPSLQDDFGAKGRLTVTPAPTVVIAGDCPVEAGGGYTGLEHYYYLIEVAEPDPAGNARFVYSRFGGGLTGRGSLDPVSHEVTVTHNAMMIDNSGLTNFHLQALEEDPLTGCWRVVFWADASLVENGRLALSNRAGTWPAAPGERAFFRLWDGIAAIGDFGAATGLQDGIRLQFDAPAAGNVNYRPGDYWCFPVRASGVGFDPSIWPDNAPPKGVVYHRAPLGILNWTEAPPDSLTAPDEIDDCRDVFRPLTETCHCCRYTVGDGRTSHGDFDSIEQAIRHLPVSGGEICLLPGLHETNARIEDRANVRIHGCGKDTRVIPRAGTREDPVFHIVDSECIVLSDMDLVSLSGTVVVAEASEEGLLRQLTIERNRILACRQAIHVEDGSETLIRENRIRMLDKRGAGVAVFLTGEDSRIERNDIGVVPAEVTPEPPPPDDGEDPPDDPNDPCADADRIYAAVAFLYAYIDFVWGFLPASIVPPPYLALGGIQIGAGSERIKVLDNEIVGGAGNGVTLGGSTHDAIVNLGDFDDGTVEFSNNDGAITGQVLLPDGNDAAGVTLRLRLVGAGGSGVTDVTDADGTFEFGPLVDGTYEMSVASPGYGVAEVEKIDEIQFGAFSIGIYRVRLEERETPPDPSLAFLYDIRIENNDIFSMGLNGIGIPPRLEVLTARQGGDNRTGDQQTNKRNTLAQSAAVNAVLALLGNPVIDLSIHRNRIVGCLQNPFDEELRETARTQGLGGISLGLCETVTISGNRIEGNGRRHIDPVAGIFFLFGEQMEITDNLIRDNGPLAETGDLPMVEGMRGGIIGIAATIGLQDLFLDRSQILASGKPACRVHDNVVQHPAGRSVTLTGLGPISICGNHLTTEMSADDAMSRFVGGFLLINFGGLGRLPAGNCLINGNQVRLGSDSDSFLAAAALSTGDIGYDGNQTEALQQGVRVNDNISLMLNTLLWGATVRATDSRFIEGSLGVELPLQVSLLSLGNRLNTTTMNQGDHCIFAFSGGGAGTLMNPGNLVIDTTYCGGLQDTVEVASSFKAQTTRG